MRWLRFRLLRDSRRRHREARQWLANHPRVARFLERTGCLNVDEYALARGIAVGMFVGLTPTVGIQTILMMLGSMTFRANFLAAFAVSWVSNPLTMAPLYFGFNRIGDAVFGWLLDSMAWLSGVSAEIVRETAALFLGSLLVAMPASVIGYGLFLWAWRKLGLRLGHKRRRTPSEPIDSGAGTIPEQRSKERE